MRADNRNLRHAQGSAHGCVSSPLRPEKGGEGLRDIRVIEALLESAGTGRAIRIPPLTAELWTAQACSIEPGH
jgi:hypothetical protein